MITWGYSDIITHKIIEISDTDCIYSHGLLKLPRFYTQGNDGRVVINATEMTHFLVQDETEPIKTFRIIKDSLSSNEKYVAYLKSGIYEIEIKQSVKLTLWYRLYVPRIGHWNHTEKLDEGHTLFITDANITDPNDSNLNRWLWKKGQEYEFSKGKHIFIIDWQGGIKLSQLAFLPVDVEPNNNEILSPTYNYDITPSKGIILIGPVRLSQNEIAQKVSFDAELSGGKVGIELSVDGGKNWQKIESDGVIPDSYKSYKNIFLRLTLEESEDKTSPIIGNLSLQILRSENIKIPSIPQECNFSGNNLPLIPAQWQGIRTLNDKYSLSKAIFPDENGILWMDMDNASNIILAPKQESSVLKTPSGVSIYQGVLNRNLISFDIYIQSTQMYRPWFRVKLHRSRLFTEEYGIKEPYYPFVVYQVDREHFTAIDYSKITFAEEPFYKGEWIWLPGESRLFRNGSHVFRIRAGLEYMLLDRIALIPEGMEPPKDRGGNSNIQIVPEGEIFFFPINVTISRFLQVIAEGESQNNNVEFFYSADEGTSWKPIKEVKSTELSQLYLKAVITKTHNNQFFLPNFKAEFEKPFTQIVVLSNKNQKILFDIHNGTLFGWWSLESGWILPPGNCQPLFRFSIGYPGAGLQKITPEPRNMTDYQLLLKSNWQQLNLKYCIAENIDVTVQISLPTEGLSTWQITIDNKSKMEIRNVEFPILAGVRIGSDPENNMAVAVNNHSGADFPGAPFYIPGNPKPYIDSPLGLSGIYPGYYSMGWLTLYNSKGGFTVQVRNTDGVGTKITFVPSPSSWAMDIGFNRMIYIGPGEKSQSTYEVGCYKGDWHEAADIYSAWAHSWMDFSRINSNWAKNVDGWIRGTNMAARFLSHWLPLTQLLEIHPVWGQNFANSIDGMYSSSAFPLINPRYGTPEEFRNIQEKAREHGLYTTYYWNSRGWTDDYADKPFIGPTPRNLIPSEVEIPPRGFGPRWAQRDFSGKTGVYPYLSRFTDEGFNMCTASTGWKEMLFKGAVNNYIKLQGASGIYFDQACNFYECYADDHGHGKQHGLWNKGLQEVFRQIIDEGRKINPDIVLAIEGCPDQLMQYADLGLWVWSPYCDGVPFLYTFPEAKLVRGYNNPGGIWCRSIEEYNRSIHLFLRGDFINDRRFYAHRNRIKDWMYNSRFMDDKDLEVSPLIVAKWFKREEKEYTGALINIQNEEEKEGEVYIKWPMLANTKYAFAYLYDEETVVRVNLRNTHDGVIVSVPPAKASSILIPVKFPENESIRFFVLWPREQGMTDIIKVVLINISSTDKNVSLDFTTTPNILKLENPPSMLNIPAGTIKTLKVDISGREALSALNKVGMIITTVKDGQYERTFSCPVAPSIFNGGFEIDTYGNGTPDGWETNSNEIFIHLLQQPDLSFPLYQADGIMETNNPPEGKYSLRLNGVVEFLNRWTPSKRIPDAQRQLKPYIFNTSQYLFLKPLTRYRITFFYKFAATTDSNAYIEVSSIPVGESYVQMEHIFPVQIITHQDEDWHEYSFEFDVPPENSTIPLVFANHSRDPIWIDSVRVLEIGHAKTKQSTPKKTIISGLSLSEILTKGKHFGVWGIYDRRPIIEKGLSVIKSTNEGVISLEKKEDSYIAIVRRGKTDYGPIVYVQLPEWTKPYSEVEIFIEFLDVGTGNINLNYRSSRARWASIHTNKTQLSNSNNWKILKYYLKDAFFNSEPFGGFRIWVPEGFIFRSIAVLLPGQLKTEGFEDKEPDIIQIKHQATPHTEFSNNLLSRKVSGAWSFYGDIIIENGITLLKETGEGVTKTIDINGIKALGIDYGKAKYGKYYYFKLCDWVKIGNEYDITIEYFDGGEPGKIFFSYDALINGEKTSNRIEIVLTGVKEWKVFTTRIKDALFEGRRNYGADFRIGSAPDGFAIGAISITPVLSN